MVTKNVRNKVGRGHRIDIQPSSEHVEVFIDGVKVADSTNATVLLETGAPPRYYLPRSDVRFDLFEPSSTHTMCPYKGEASYFSVEVNGNLYEDIVWTYPSPITASEEIAELVSFYNEKVDLRVDGQPQAGPKVKVS